MEIRAIDLFCGAGGSSLGARSAGVKIIAGFDLWPLAGKIHEANFPESLFVQGRLEEHRLGKFVKQLGRIDLILASPECTNHSPAKGNKPRCEESKNTAFQVIRYAKAFTPRWIVIENVVGMRRWCRYAEYRQALARLGYHITEQILNSRHFGVGQARRRLFLTCDLQQKPKTTTVQGWPTPSAAASLQLRAGYKWSPLFSARRSAETLVRAKRAIHELGERDTFLLVYYGSDGAGGWQRLNRPLRTITTVDRFAVVKWIDGVHYMRMLQVPELQNAMGMTGLKIDAGTRRERIKMLGNAVCPPVMCAVIKDLIPALGERKDDRG